MDEREAREAITSGGRPERPRFEQAAIFIIGGIAGVLTLLGLHLLGSDDWPWYLRGAATYLVIVVLMFAGRFMGRPRA
jgi:hypothetical protein